MHSVAKEMVRYGLVGHMPVQPPEWNALEDPLRAAVQQARAGDVLLMDDKDAGKAWAAHLSDALAFMI